MKIRAFAFLLTGFLVGTASAQTVIYVNQNAPASGLNNGTSWINAYHELRDALNDSKIPSATVNNPAVIYLARGTYKPTAGTDRTASFVLHSHLRIIGGFAGGESSIPAPNFANLPVLSGDIGLQQKSPVTPFNFGAPPPLSAAEAGYDDNSYNVITGVGVEDVLLQFVLVTGGNANGAQVWDELELETMAVPQINAPWTTVTPLAQHAAGGGMFLSGTEQNATNQPLGIVMNYCYFVNNTAEGYGGGMALVNTFGFADYCQFENNAAAVGGAAWMWNSRCDFDTCTLFGNVANGFNTRGDAGFGGALAYQTPATTNTVGLSVLGALMPLPTNPNNTDQINLAAAAAGAVAAQAGSDIFGVLLAEAEGAAREADQLELDEMISPVLNEMNYEAFVKPRYVLQHPDGGGELEVINWGADRSIPPLVQTTPFTLNTDLTPVSGVDPLTAAKEEVFDPGAVGEAWYQTFLGTAEMAAAGNFLPFLNSQVGIYGDSTAQQLKDMEMFLYNETGLSSLVNCQFTSNSASAGGGAIATTDYNIHAEDCQFLQNQADDGGAIYSADFSTPEIISCAFATNMGVRGSSVMDNARHSFAQIVNSTLVYNTSTQGEAIGNERGSEAHISNCILWDNAGNGYDGPDIYTATRTSMATEDPAGATAYDQASDGSIDFTGLCDLRSSIMQSLASIHEGQDDLSPLEGNSAYSDIPTISTGGLGAISAAGRGEKLAIRTQQIENAATNFAAANANGQFQCYGLYNSGQGFRPGTKTTFGNISADPSLFDGFELGPNSPAIGLGNSNLIDNLAVSSFTDDDVTGAPRFTPIMVGTNLVERLDAGAAQYPGAPVSELLLVNLAATGANTGLTWKDALTNLQVALSKQNAEVWVAKGTYVPTAGSGGTFTLADGVRVYGGFSGMEVDRSQRDWQASVTVLSGNPAAENSVVTCANISTNSVLDGFTITQGGANQGAGMYCHNSPVTVRNCIFLNNQADGAGGGLYSEANGGPVGPLVANCQFLNNSGGYGGAVASFNEPMTMQNCLFEHNQGGEGGAVWGDYSSMVIVGGLFVSNSVLAVFGDGSATGGAALYATGPGANALVNCTIADNVGVNASDLDGGGAVNVNATATFRALNCILWGNTVSGESDSTQDAQITVQPAPALDLENSILQGLASGGFQGDSPKDPLFNNPTAGDFSLNAFSPAIDQGQMLFQAAYYVPYDLAGDPRIAGVSIDMGAYEFTGIPQSLATVVSDTVDCGQTPPGQNPTQVLSLLSQSAANTSSYQWLVDRQDGNGLVVLTDDANHIGSATGTLAVTNPPLSMSGWQYELTAQPDFISDVYTLQVAPPVIYVNAAATGAQTGADWADAYTNIQDGIDRAAPCTEVWVAAGTYRPEGQVAANAFHLRPGVPIYGGFAGDETTLDQRAWQSNVTVLSANWQPLGINLQNENVLVNDGSVPGIVIDATAILDGFTVLGSLGPLIENKQASPTIQNCVLISADGTIPLQNLPGATPVLTNCIFATIPAPLCDLGGGGTFAVSNFNGTISQFTWEVNSGPGFGPVAEDPAYDGIFQLSAGAGFSDLTLLSIPPADATDLFIFTNDSGYVSPALSLSVGTPPVVYVNAAATGLNNGTSWANAYNDLQSAISADSGCVEIWVAQGTYAPNVSIANWFSLRSQAAVYGGFTGTETMRSQRNWAANPTRLTGLAQNDVVNNNSPMNASAVLDGFQFSNQTAAVVINNSSEANPTIQNCLFAGNSGISIYANNASPTILGCSFLSNRAAAVYAVSGATNGAINVASCTFTNNTNTLPGGALHIEAVSVNVTGCQFSGNQAQSGGAIYLANEATVTANQTFFQGNQAKTGGAVFVGYQASLAASNCLFDNNASQFEGGAISHFGNQLTLAQCTIVDNSALLQGGGAYLFGQGAVIENSIFWNNSVTYAGGAGVIIAPEEAQLDGDPSALGPGALTLNSSIVQNLQTNGSGPVLYVGNLCASFDPLFANPAAGNYQLTAASPAIGAGDASVSSESADLAGNPREVSGRLDLGSYEFQGTPGSPLALLAQPGPQTVCSGTTVALAIAGATNASYGYQWLYNNGGGFIPASDGGFAIDTVSNTSTLTIGSATSAMSGWQFEVAIGAYTSPAATLTVIEPSVLYVQPGGQGDGSSWASAMGSIGDAVAAANGCTAIWVAGGAYTLTNGAGRPVSLQMKAGAQILGGFAGTETSAAQRDWNAHPTILEPAPAAGDAAPALVENDGGSFVIDRTAILDGFVLENGANGIVNNSADPTIRNCVFSNFTGYAVFNGYRAAPLLENCVFRNNLNTALESFSSAVVASNCVFQANAAAKNGGAIDNEGGSMILAGSQFTGNASSGAGGALYGLFCDTRVTRCLFAGNSAEYGGAVSAQNGTLAADNSLFNANTSTAGGGALDLENATNEIVNCTIYGNEALGGAGGGVYAVGGSIAMANSILWLDTAAYATGLESEQLYAAPDSGAAAQVSYSCLQGLTTYAGNHNSDDDPVFQDAPHGNFALNGYSPLLNSGNVALATNSALDLAGHARTNFLDAVDPGAYEQENPPQGALQVAMLPVSQNVCDGSDAVFAIQIPTGGSTNYYWTGHYNNGYVPSSDPTEVIVSNDIVELVIRNVTAAMTGWSFSFDDLVSGYASPDYVLTVVEPGIIYVNASNASAPRDGKSWAGAFTNLATALDAAAPCSQIWVAKGTYGPGGQSALGAFSLRAGVGVYGGFNGSETSLGQRDWTNNPTLILGGSNQAAIYNDPDIFAVDNSAVLDGFTVKGTNGNSAMFNTGATLTVRNCAFAGNTALAIDDEDASPVFDTCAFSNNLQGAVFNNFGSPLFTNCLFYANSNPAGGAAIQNSSTAALVTGCVFAANNAASGGAISDDQSTNIYQYCYLTNNSAQEGGAFEADGAGAPELLRYCLIVNNSAASAGGAINIAGANVSLINCTLFGNSAAGHGGGISQVVGASQVLNSILWNDTDSTGPGPNSELNVSGGTMAVNTSDIQGWNGPGAANTPYDPLFIDADHGNFMVWDGSPARLIANTNYDTNITVDLAGIPLWYAPGWDAGAYEMQQFGSAVGPQDFIQGIEDQTACSGNIATYAVVVTNAPGGYDPAIFAFNWQYNTGAGWTDFAINFANNTFYGPPLGAYGFTAGADGSSYASSIAVSGITPAMDGWQFRVSVSFGSPAYQTTTLHVAGGPIYVNASSAPGGDGLSWATAYNTLDAAVGDIACRREIWVAGGTYTPQSALQFPDRTLLYGGFAGNETTLSQRNPPSNPTVINGGGIPNDAMLQFNGSNVAEDTNSMFDGFVVSNAPIGAMVLNCSPWISNCVFTANGTGLDLQGNATVGHCQFEGNLDHALTIEGFSPEILYSRIAANLGSGSSNAAVAIDTQGVGSPDLVYCLITGNYGGALSVMGSGGHPGIYNCTVAGNYSAAPGAAIYNRNPAFLVENSIVWANGSATTQPPPAAELYSSWPNGIQAYNSDMDKPISLAVLNSLTNNNVIDWDPMFVAAPSWAAAPTLAGDYHLQACSPVAGAGDFAINQNLGLPDPYLAVYLPNPLIPVLVVSNDFDGNPNTTAGVPSRGPDLGAYQFQGALQPHIVIFQPPDDSTNCLGEPARFSIEASETDNATNVSYQWQQCADHGANFTTINDGPNYLGSATARLTILGTPASFDQNQYRCVVTGQTSCDAISTPATLTLEPNRWFVNASAAPGGDGKTWDSAFNTLEAALDNPYLNLCGTNEIWVAGGTYIPASTITLPQPQIGGPPLFTLEAPPIVRIYGGFAGNETDLSQRNWAANPTVIRGSGVTMFKGSGEVFTPEDTFSTVTNALVDGLVIVGAGVAFDLSAEYDLGIVNCTFISNSIPINNSGCQLAVTNCRFLWSSQPVNIASVTYRGEPSGAKIDFEQCWFQANQFDLAAVTSFAQAVMNNCVISGNSAQDLFYLAGGGVSLANCTVTGNNAAYDLIDGGGFVQAYNSIAWNNSNQGQPEDNTIFLGPGDDSATDPEFAEPILATDAPTTNGNFSLNVCSPLINQGINGYAPEFGVDILGNPRVIGGSVDVGAFEYQGGVLQLTGQSGSQNASFASDVQFSVTGLPVTGFELLYQWQLSTDSGANFANITDDSHYSGTTNALLSVTNITAAMSGYEYRCQLMSDGCQLFSTRVTLSFGDATVSGNGPTFGTTPAALYDPVSFSLGPDLDPNSVSAADVLLQGDESGTLPASFSFDGNTVTLDPRTPYFPGEKVEVSATSGLEDQADSGAQPFVWDFRATVPNANSLQYYGVTLSSNSFADVVVGDFNHDGYLDLLGVGASGAQLWTNDGAGNLIPGQTLAVGAITSARAADLNGDGWLDAVMLGADGTISIWLNNNGALTYSGQTIGAGVLGLALGDLSGLGAMDLFFVGNGPAQVWLNDGNGAFSDSGQRLGAGGADVQLGDLNADGTLDAVVAGLPGAANLAWMNQGFGLFAVSLQALGLAGGGSKVIVADFTGQDRLDVLVTQTNGPTQAWANNGAGAFLSLSGEVTRPGDPIYADYNFGSITGDNGAFPCCPARNVIDNDPATGFLDLQGQLGFVVTPSRGPSIINGISLTSVSNLESVFNGFESEPEIDPLAVQVYGADGGGWTEIFSTNLPDFSDGQTITLPFANNNIYTSYYVVMGIGNNFDDADDYITVAEVALLETNRLPAKIAAASLADLNADASLDFCFVQTNGQFALWQNQGGANFQPSPLIGAALGAAPPTGGTAVAAGDFDHNGALSLVTAGAGGISLLRNMNLVGSAENSLAAPQALFSNIFAAFASNSLGQVTFLSLPADVTLLLNGSPVSTGTIYSFDSLADLQLTPPPYFAGGLERFTWRGVSTDPVTQTNTVTALFTHVIYPPIAANYTIDVVRGQSTNELVGGANSVLANDTDPNGGTLTASLLGPPSAGSVTINSDGAFLYTQDNSETPTDSFTYLVTSSEGAESVGTVSVSINLYTTHPYATNESFVTSVDTPIDITLTGSDPNGDALQFAILANPANGTLSGAPPDVAYTPNLGYSGADTFTYKTYDTLSNSPPATVSILVNPLPQTSDLSYTITAPGPFAITLPGSDSFNYPLTFAITQGPTNGLLTGGGSNWVYTANPNFHGLDGFVFTVTDPYSDSVSGSASLNVATAFPTAGNLSFTITNPYPLDITLPGADAAKVPLTFSINSGPGDGSVTGDANSSNWVYQPNPMGYGPDSFGYTVQDPYGNSASGTVSVLDLSRILWVTNVLDSGAATLRAGITRASAAPAPGPWLIAFAPSLAGQSVQLESIADSSFGLSSLVITSTIVIDGAMAPGVGVARGPFAATMRLFRVATNGNLTLRNVALSGGYAYGGSGGSGAGGGGGGGAFGGAILNDGVLQISNAVFFNNTAFGGNAGSGAYYGSAGGLGGGVNGGAGGANLGASPSPGAAGGFDGGGGGGGGLSLSGGPGLPGFGGGQGGGIASESNLLSYGGTGGFGGGGGGAALAAGGGGAGFGGAIFNNAGTVLVASSTFASNSAFGGYSDTSPSQYFGSNGSAYGGAIFNYNGILTIINSACTNNVADDGGAIYNVGDGLPGVVLETNLLLSNPRGGADEKGTALNSGTSLFLPQLVYTLADTSSSAATLSVFPTGSSNQIIGVTQGSIGRVTFTPNSVTYTQAGSPANTDTFTFTVTNGAGASYVATVQVSITIVHHAPIAGNIVVSAYRGYPITIDPLTNCFDPDGNPLTITQVGFSSLGSISSTATNLTYYERGSPATHDSFTYRVSDGYLSANATITVNFLPFVLSVTNAGDSGPGTLREALVQANAVPSAPVFVTTPTLWTIQFDPSLAGKTLFLSSVGDTNFGPSGLLVSGSTQFDASAAPGFTITRDPAAPPMRLIEALGTLYLNGLTLSNGLARGQDRTDGSLNGVGGAVLVYWNLQSYNFFAYLTATNTVFTGNEALGGPGQPGNAGGSGLGGAVYVNVGVSLIANCTLSGNSAVGGAAGAGGGAPGLGMGGAFYAANSYYGDSVESSVITNNTADQGGGIYNLNNYFYLADDVISNDTGIDLVNSVSSTNFTYTDVYDWNEVGSQTAPWLPTIPNVAVTNGGQIHFSATPDFDGATNYAVTFYAYDNNTEEQVTNGVALTNSGTNYTLAISPLSCQGQVLGVDVTLLDGSLEYDSFFYVTNLVPLLAENESLETDKNTALTEINVLTNDCGTYAYILSFATNGTIGQVTLNDDGTFTYNPAPLVNGIPTTVFPTLGQGKTATDTFTYTIIDAAGHTAVGTITVTVDGVNDAPTPSNPIITRLPGTNEVLISVASLGGDPDGDLVTLVSFNATTTNGGKVTLSGDNLIFIPHDDHSTDAFNYTLSDPYDATVVGRVLITVDPLSNPGVIAIQPVADDFVCAFRAQPAQTYIVEESDNAAGPWTVVGPAAANSNGTYTFRDTDASPTQRFFRIVTQ